VWFAVGFGVREARLRDPDRSTDRAITNRLTAQFGMDAGDELIAVRWA
jgi:hypothetical protein